MNIKLPMWVKRLKIVFTPTYWDKTYSHSPKWEKELLDLMEQHRFEPALHNNNNYICKLGDKWIWIANHPFASYSCYSDVHPNRHPYMNSPHGNQHPSRYVTYLAHKKRLKDFKNYEERKIIENRLINGDGISPRKKDLKAGLLKWN